MVMMEYKSNFWDERYSSEEYVYGTEPNQFFKEQMQKINPAGRLLLPGEGEGRNAVFAAQLGWEVDAFDQSIAAKQKALNLASVKNVRINYTNIDLAKFKPQKEFYECAGLIFVHLTNDIRNEFYQKIIYSLKQNGKLILELFSKDQLGKNSGGPQNPDMLSSTEEIKNEFKDLKSILLKEENVYLNEGKNHSGEASVIRFVGEKV
jgi:SAM-dependent methyltransferase